MKLILLASCVLLGGCALTDRNADPRAVQYCQSIGGQYLTAAYANCLANKTKEFEGKS